MIILIMKNYMPQIGAVVLLLVPASYTTAEEYKKQDPVSSFIEYIFTAPAKLMENAAERINNYQKPEQKKEQTKKPSSLETKTSSEKTISDQPLRFRRGIFKRR